MKSPRAPRRLQHEFLESRRPLDASGIAAGEPTDEFHLTDVNSTSPTFGQQVSPRDFAGGTTAWYFIHST